MIAYQTTHIVFFSPTHTTEKVARAIGEGIGMGRRIETDLTLDEADSPIEIADSLVVLAAPVYAGRVAPVALQRMQRLRGNNSPVVLVAVYGNRDYEDALVELRDTAVGLGFTPLSAGAFIGEHSYSLPQMPIAMGRPDDNDLALARQFGKDSLNKLEKQLEAGQTVQSFPSFPIKGNVPYREVVHGKPTAPECTEGCFACGECIDVCPTHAIHFNADRSRVETDVMHCIRCCACVKVCPNGARVYHTPYAAILHEKCSVPRLPELFF